MIYDEISIGMKVTDTKAENIGEVVHIHKIGVHKPIVVKWLKPAKYSGTQHVWPSELYQVIEE